MDSFEEIEKSYPWGDYGWDDHVYKPQDMGLLVLS